MSTRTNFLLMFPELIVGAEEEGDSTVIDSTNTESEDSEGTNTEGEPQGTDEVNEDKEEEDGRTKALKAERKLKREAEAEAKRLRAENEALKQKDMGELDLAQSQLKVATETSTTLQEKLDRFATGVRNKALNDAIKAEATKQNFIDTSDAIAGVDISEIEIDQDEDDPSLVTIDLKAVTKAVKKLASSKPHFTKTGTSDGHPTGSTFGGSRNGNKPDVELDELRRRYPNL